MHQEYAQIKRMNNGTVQIIVTSRINQDQAEAIFQAGLGELYSASCRLLVIDLRATRLLDDCSLFKIYKLIHLLNTANREEQLSTPINVLYSGADCKQAFLEQTVNREGIQLKFSETPITLGHQHPAVPLTTAAQ
ncbi:hypothetical protein [Desulfogranum mediterraneum]|uniref:hypothetical protein n=1 Tax=Desulfogranum mediterraneum TaxID=160661 RepID=UPI001294738D|nr:hypothetical protein [Desulfogranum mediterraneum]